MIGPLISIIIPCYNSREELFRPCLSSAISQTYTNIEILIVDDGSKPETAAFLAEMALSDSRIRYIRKPNGGVSSARNLGVKEAKGDYIAFLDDDDALPDYFVAEATDVAMEGDYDIVIGGTQILHTEKEEGASLSGGRAEPRTPQEMKLVLSSAEERIEFGGAYVGRGVWARLIRRKVALAVPMDETFSYGEDAVWNQRFLSQERRCALVRSIWYYYVRYNERSVTARFDPYMHIKSAKLMRELRRWTDMDNDVFCRAYGYHLIEELLFLYRHETRFLPLQERRKVCASLYAEEPWTFLLDQHFRSLCDKVHRAEAGLYGMKMLFPVYGIYWWLRRLTNGELHLFGKHSA